MSCTSPSSSRLFLSGSNRWSDGTVSCCSLARLWWLWFLRDLVFFSRIFSASQIVADHLYEMYFFFSFLSCLYDDFPWEEDWGDNCDEDHSVLFFFHVKETLVVLEDSPMRTWRGWCCYRLLIILLLLCVLGLCVRRRVLFFFSWGRWSPTVSLWARRGNSWFLVVPFEMKRILRNNGNKFRGWFYSWTSRIYNGVKSLVVEVLRIVCLFFFLQSWILQ